MLKNLIGACLESHSGTAEDTKKTAMQARSLHGLGMSVVSFVK